MRNADNENGDPVLRLCSPGQKVKWGENISLALGVGYPVRVNASKVLKAVFLNNFQGSILRLTTKKNKNLDGIGSFLRTVQQLIIGLVVPSYGTPGISVLRPSLPIRYS